MVDDPTDEGAGVETDITRERRPKNASDGSSDPGADEDPDQLASARGVFGWVFISILFWVLGFAVLAFEWRGIGDDRGSAQVSPLPRSDATAAE